MTNWTPENLNKKWYVVFNDLIGGWSIQTINKSPSFLKEEEYHCFVGDIMSKTIARHIVEMHNEHLA